MKYLLELVVFFSWLVISLSGCASSTTKSNHKSTNNNNNNNNNNNIFEQGLAYQDWQEAKTIASTNYAQSLDFYYQKLLTYPEDINYKAYFARLLYDTGNFLSAKDYMQEVFAQNYREEWFYEFFSEVLLKERQIELANKYLKIGLKLAPTSEKLLWISARLLAEKSPAKSLSILNGLTSLSIEQYQFKYALEVATKDYDQADKTLTNSIKDYPAFEDFYEKHVLFYLSLNKNTLALAKIDQSLRLFPKNAKFYNFKALLLERQNKHAQAIKINQIAIELDPDEQGYQIFAAKAYWATEQYDASAKIMQSLIDEGKGDLIFYQWLSRYYQLNSQPFSAEAVVLKGLSMLNNQVFLHNRGFSNLLIYEYAIIQEHKRKHQLAIENLSSLLVEDPDNSQLNYDLARNYVLASKPIEALPYFEKALSGEDQQSQVHNMIAEFYVDTLIDLKRFPEALAFIKTKISSKESWIDLKLALIELYKVNFQKANNHFKEFHAKNSVSSPRDRYIEAAILQGLGDNGQVAKKLAEFGDYEQRSLKRHINFAKFRLNPSTGPELLADYIKFNSPILAYMELQAYLDKSYLTRAWKNSKITVKAFEAIILGENFRDILPNVPTQWKSYLELLALSLDIYPTKELTPLIGKPDDKPWMLVYQADYWQKNDRNELALALLEQGTKLYQENPWLNGFLVAEYIRKKDYHATIKAINLYLKTYPASLWAKLELSFCYDSLKMSKKAEEYLLEVMSKDETNPTIFNNLAWLYLTSDDVSIRKPKLALVYAKKAVNYASVSAFLDTLAEAYFQNKQYKKAKEAIEKALIMDLSNSDHFKRQLIKIEEAIKKFDS
ncbi:MAG: tetratricopeptide repeat protein [SAR324 cluster bacterium]|nr:tetratricopeptide repeat protein [SAR324 cluster bacterium]